MGNLAEFDTNELRQFSQTLWVYNCVSTICDEITSMDWDIVAKEDWEYESIKDEISRVKDWLKYPNKNNEPFSMIIRALLKDILELDAGVLVKVFNRESYDYDNLEPKSGAPALKPKGERMMEELYCRDGSSFLKETDKFGFTKGYWQYSYQIPAHPMWFNREEICYMMRNQRSMSCYGYSPCQAVLDLVKSLHYSVQYNKKFFDENSVPDGMISLLDTNPTEMKGFVDNFVREFKAQPHKLAIINKDVKWTPMIVTNNELQFLETQNWYYKLVISAFGLTPAELGLTDDINRSTSSTQSELSRRKGIRPLLRMLEQYINEEIISEFQVEGVEFQFIYDDPAEKAQRLANWQIELNSGIKTINEVREELGMEPTEGGDKSNNFASQFGRPSPFEEQGSESETGNEEETDHFNNEESQAEKKTEKQIKKSMTISKDDVLRIAESYNFKGDLNELRMGLEVEQEHGDVVGNDLNKLAQIALAHLSEDERYYTKLKEMEKSFIEKFDKALSQDEKREIIDVVYEKLKNDIFLIWQRMGRSQSEAAQFANLIQQRGRIKSLKKQARDIKIYQNKEGDWNVKVDGRLLPDAWGTKQEAEDYANDWIKDNPEKGIDDGQYYREPAEVILHPRGKSDKNKIICPSCGKATLNEATDESGRWRCLNCSAYLNEQDLLDIATEPLTANPKDRGTPLAWSPKSCDCDLEKQFDMRMTVKSFLGFDYQKSYNEIEDYIDSAEYRTLLNSYLTDLPDVTVQKIIEVLRISLKKGLSMSDIKRGVYNIIKDENRADKIARTEVVRIANEGNRIKMEKEGVKDVLWISAPEDGRLCKECMKNNHKIFKLKDIKNKIPLHPNCRCSFTEKPAF